MALALASYVPERIILLISEGDKARDLSIILRWHGSYTDDDPKECAARWLKKLALSYKII